MPGLCSYTNITILSSSHAIFILTFSPVQSRLESIKDADYTYPLSSTLNYIFSVHKAQRRTKYVSLPSMILLSSESMYGAQEVLLCRLPRCTISTHGSLPSLWAHIVTAHLASQAQFYVPCPVKGLYDHTTHYAHISDVIRSILTGCPEEGMRLSSVVSHFEAYHHALSYQDASVHTILKPSCQPVRPQIRTPEPLPVTTFSFSISAPVVIPHRRQRVIPSSQTLGPRWSRLNALEEDDEERPDISFDDLPEHTPQDLPPSLLSQMTFQERVRDAPQLSYPPAITTNYTNIPSPPKSAFYDTFSLKLAQLEASGIVVSGDGTWPGETREPTPALSTTTTATATTNTSATSTSKSSRSRKGAR